MAKESRQANSTAAPRLRKRKLPFSPEDHSELFDLVRSGALSATAGEDVLAPYAAKYGVQYDVLKKCIQNFVTRENKRTKQIAALANLSNLSNSAPSTSLNSPMGLFYYTENGYYLVPFPVTMGSQVTPTHSALPQATHQHHSTALISNGFHLPFPTTADGHSQQLLSTQSTQSTAHQSTAHVAKVLPHPESVKPVIMQGKKKPSEYDAYCAVIGREVSNSTFEERERTAARVHPVEKGKVFGVSKIIADRKDDNGVTEYKRMVNGEHPDLKALVDTEYQLKLANYKPEVELPLTARTFAEYHDRAIEKIQSAIDVAGA
ncbi:hypothetical protein HDU79_011491 [Rhizoclosmatium sp. JEL0117]|nr:hypothetical protein HDU79_011491 [Rhizoclosmatium sp. JEL0117]